MRFEETLRYILDVTRAKPSSGRGRWMGLCPAHPDRTPSLSIREDGGKILLYCFAGCTTEAILDSLGLSWESLFAEGDDDWLRRIPTPLPTRKPDPDEEDLKWKEELEKLWASAIPIDRAPIALAYLEGRGLDLEKVLPVNLRFHPALPYRDEEGTREFPALLARVEGERGLVALHRTYITPDGRKAPVSSPKRLTPPTRPGGTMGAAVRLYPLEGTTLVVAEGIETALALRELTGLPVWATVSAGHMARLALPAGIRELWVGADSDRVGLQKGLELATRAAREGIRVRFLPAPLWGLDWLDLKALFPVSWPVWKKRIMVEEEA